VAIGCAGLPALLDLRGDPDLFGRSLQTTVVAHADEIAAAASLLMGQADEARPVIVVRGLARRDGGLPASSLIRQPDEDLFR
jgi:coenzyme F420-0:L-glutamate ligase/coenzyme F420-1:gamma-L-glutamate ligase